MNPEISLVIATYNRSSPLKKLLNNLKQQSLSKNKWDVIVAVDGSSDDTTCVLENTARENSLPLTWFYQENAGQCVARHNAILKSTAEKVIIIDDDLNPTLTFIESHLKALREHGEKTIIIGKVLPTEEWHKRPLYELVREYSTTVTHDKYERGLLNPTWESCVTQNVSFFRLFYLEVGGFDPELRLGEDTEIGFRFAKAGGSFVFCKDACAIHESNIGSYKSWLRRQFEYGKYAWMAWKKNNEDVRFHPLHNFVNGSKLNRLAIVLVVRSCFLTNVAVCVLHKVGNILHKIKLLYPAIVTHKAIMSIMQHQGLKNIYGSWTAFRQAEKEFLLYKKNEL